MEHEGSLSVTCCSYLALFNAENRGVATLHPGEIFVGGDADGSTFDYVQNIVPIHTAKGVMGYDVSVRRMSCIEPQPMPTIQQYQHLQQVQHPPQSFVSFQKKSRENLRILDPTTVCLWNTTNWKLSLLRKSHYTEPQLDSCVSAVTLFGDGAPQATRLSNCGGPNSALGSPAVARQCNSFSSRVSIGR